MTQVRLHIGTSTLALLLVAVVCGAQELRGRITGVVTDNTGRYEF